MGIPLHAPESALPAVAVPSAVPVPCTLVDAPAKVRVLSGTMIEAAEDVDREEAFSKTGLTVGGARSRRARRGVPAAGAEGAAAQQLGVRSGFWRFSAISTQGSQRLRCKSPLRTECAVA